MEYPSLPKPNSKTFKRHIWDYEHGNYELLCQKAYSFGWNSLHDEDIDKYTKNITIKIISIAKECIPNRTLTVHPSDPPWITELKRYIRKRKRPYQRARIAETETDWRKFKKLRY